jgi:hypothetical protein
MENFAKGPLMLPTIDQVQQILRALLNLEGFELRIIKSDPQCQTLLNNPSYKFSDGDRTAFGLLADKSLDNGNVMGAHYINEGLNLLFGTKDSPIYSRVVAHEFFHALFNGHVDDKSYPQFFELMKHDSLDTPMSIMETALPYDPSRFDGRLGLLDMIMVQLSKHLSEKNGGGAEFEKIRECTEVLQDFREMYKSLGCQEISPEQLKSMLALKTTLGKALSTTPESTLGTMTTSTPESMTTSTPPATATTPVPSESEGIMNKELSDKIATQILIETCAIVIGSIAKLSLSAVIEDEKKQDAIASFSENFARLVTIAAFINPNTALQSLLFPAMVSSYKAVEASAEGRGFTPPSELMKNAVTGVIGSEAQERIVQTYANTPGYLKLMATQFAFISAIHLASNLMENEEKDQLSYSKSLTLGFVTALYSAVLRGACSFLEKKIRRSTAGQEGGSMTSASEIELGGVQTQVSDLVLASGRLDSPAPAPAPAQTSAPAPASTQPPKSR